MNDFTVCNLCAQPGTFADAAEKVSVACHLRSLSHLHFTVWRCANCLSIHALEPADLDFFYERYPFRAQKLDAGTRVVYLNRLSLLRRKARLQKNHRILDFGSGQGLFVEYLRTKGYQNAFGYDPYVSEKSDGALLSQQFNCVMAQDVIEHVADPRATVKMLMKCLADGGVLVLGSPRAEGIDLQQSVKHTNELHQPYHRHIPSQTAMVDMLRQEGFHSIEVHTRYYFDTLMPTVNTRFINEYTYQSGGFAEALVEPPNWKLALQNPHLLAIALTGYFNPNNANMMVFALR